MLEKVLAGVAAVVFVGVGVLAVVALRSGGDDVPEGCEVAEHDSDLDLDLSPVDALRMFVQERPDQFPVDDSWRLESDDDEVFTFVSDHTSGYYEVDIRDGMVRRYMICPDGS